MGPQPGRPNALNIVVVDDDEHYRELAASPFRKRGDIVRVTADGLEALAMCLKEPPDIILSDVKMPRMNGWQFLRLIRARPSLSSIPVIFLTSLDGAPERQLGYRLGVDAYITKPFTPEELLVRVYQVLRRSSHEPGQFARHSILHGDLEHVTLGSLLSFLELEQKTGVLLVIGEAVVRFFVARGRLMRAELEGADASHTPREILARALAWQRGQFEFMSEDVQGDSAFGDSSITSLLLEHARHLDEASSH